MKKIFLLLALASVVVFTFISCQPDEEIYKPKCKISKIWYRSDVGDPNEVYVYNEKGVLTNIVVDSVESYDFTYNEKEKTVASIKHVGTKFTETMEMSYTDRLVDKIIYKVNDTIRKEIIFTRDAETTRITNIEENYDKSFYELYNILKSSKIYGSFVADAKEIAQRIQSGEKDLVLHSSKKITYYPGKKEKYENIQSVVETYPALRQEITRTYEYDTLSFNPFYGLPYAYADYAGYYLNNKSKERVVTLTAGVPTRDITYTYSYEGQHYMNDKNYPRQFITISSENNIPIHTYILYLKK